MRLILNTYLCAYNEKNASKHLALRASLLACIDIGLFFGKT